ncbi:MAG: signal transduction histidine kinase, partial [Bacteroidia bacterium]
AAQICGTPISLISLIDADRQWFKSHLGIDAKESPREYAFCAHAINDQEHIMEIEDARNDERFKDNPLVINHPHLIFYAGVPLISEDGLPLGTLCVIDNKPKKLSQGQLKTLSALSKQVINLLSLRRNKTRLEKAIFDLEEKNKSVEEFASHAAHDLKSPLIGMTSLARVLHRDYGDLLDDEGNEMLMIIESSADKLRVMINSLLSHSRGEHLVADNKMNVALTTIIRDLSNVYNFDRSVLISLKSDLKEVTVNLVALEKIILNLVSNAVKYNDKEFTRVEIGVQENEHYYEFYVQDNGPGIDQNYQDKIFDMFKVFEMHDKYGERGSGIGLATVKRIVENMGGRIQVDSEMKTGTRFTFTIAK